MADLNGFSQFGGYMAVHEGNRRINFNNLEYLKYKGKLIAVNGSKNTETYTEQTQHSFITNTDRFYFNKGLKVLGNMYAGPTGSDLVLTFANVGTTAGVNSDMVDGWHVNDNKTGVDATVNNDLWTANKVQSQIDAMKNEILGGVGPAYDTLKEIQDAIIDDESGFSALVEKIDGKLGKTEKAVDSSLLDGLDSEDFLRRKRFAISGTFTPNILYKLLTVNANTSKSAFIVHVKPSIDLSASFIISTSLGAEGCIKITPLAVSGANDNTIELFVDKPANSTALALSVKSNSLTTAYEIIVENPYVIPITPNTTVSEYTIPSSNIVTSCLVTNKSNLPVLDFENVFYNGQNFIEKGLTEMDPLPAEYAAIKASGKIASTGDIISKATIKGNEIQVGLKTNTNDYYSTIGFNPTTRSIEFNFLS